MEQPTPEEARALRRVIWISFITALGVYGIIGVLVFAPDARETAVPSWFFALVAVIAGVGSLIVPRLIGDSPPTAQGVRKREIVGWAMAEGVGVAGLTSLILGGSTQAFLLYLAAGVVLLVIQPPRD